MSGQENKTGLRFDIFERVQLKDELEGVASLEEIELTPQIQLLNQGDQTLLKGHLLLNGSYTGKHSGKQKLEHAIPVEITMPSERVERSDGVGVEIENFDVDVVEHRSLNVTGILSLSGISHAVQPKMNTEEEEVVFVHHAGQDRETDKTTKIPQSEELRAEVQHEHQEEVPAQEELPQAVQGEQLEAAENTQPAPVTEAANVEPAADKQEIKLAFSSQKPAQTEAPLNTEQLANMLQKPPSIAPAAESGMVKAQSEALGQPFTGKRADAEAIEQASAAADAAEAVGAARSTVVTGPEGGAGTAGTGIAAGSAGTVGAAGTGIAAGSGVAAGSSGSSGSIGSVGSSGASGSADSAETTDSAELRNEASENDSSSTEGALWKNLLLNRSEEEQTFRRLRMCIVQKEETLSSIAEKYSLNPKEIILYNRISEQDDVSEGQILYIPNKKA